MLYPLFSILTTCVFIEKGGGSRERAGRLCDSAAAGLGHRGGRLGHRTRAGDRVEDISPVCTRDQSVQVPSCEPDRVYALLLLTEVLI
jgi:hypothetical protein